MGREFIEADTNLPFPGDRIDYLKDIASAYYNHVLIGFIEEHRNHPFPGDWKEFLKDLASDFYNMVMVAFLGDPNIFPHPEINKLIALLERLIDSGVVSLVINVEPNGGMRLEVSGDEIVQESRLTLPIDFPKQVAEDPVFQLGMIVDIASRARDYYTGKIKEGKGNEVNRRARAWEAEALLTLQQMAQKQKVELVLNKYQLNILDENPQGLNSLPPGLNYSTPDWKQPGYG